MRFWVVPSVYLPVAVNCFVRPLAMESALGVTVMDCSAAATTVMTVVP